MKQARRQGLRRGASGRPSRRGQEGIALVLALFASAALIATGTASLMIGSADVNASRNYKGAAQVHLTAESGISRAIQAINDDGVVSYQTDIVNDWSTSYLGNTFHPMAPLPGFAYRVTAVTDPGDLAGRGRLLSTAVGPGGLQSTVVANLSRLVLPFESPGVIYLAQDDPTNANFVGNAFYIDGNDHQMNGQPGPNPPVPGIATRNDTNTQETIGSLSSGQLDNIRGAGFSWGPPVTPSIATSASSPNVAQVNQIIQTLLALPHQEFNDDRINGSFTFGDAANPKITHFTNPDGITIKGNGNASGYGIMIVDGNLTIQGSFEFFGLILVGGATTVQYDWETGLTGNALLLGSIWTTDLKLKVGGSALGLYSSEALALADSLVPNWGMPAPMEITSIVDCGQVYSGVAGCP